MQMKAVREEAGAPGGVGDVAAEEGVPVPVVIVPPRLAGKSETEGVVGRLARAVALDKQIDDVASAGAREVRGRAAETRVPEPARAAGAPRDVERRRERQQILSASH